MLGLVDNFDAIYTAWHTAQRAGSAVPSPDPVSHASRAAPKESGFVRSVETFRRRGGFTLASRAGSVLGSGLDLYHGYKLLTSDESDLAAALRREDVVMATLLEFKGELQVTTGALGLTTIGASVVLGAGAFVTVAGVAFVVAGVTLLLLDGFTLWEESEQSRLLKFFDEVLDAKEREFRRPVGNREGHDPGEGAACRTRLHLAILNHHLASRGPV